MKKLFNKEKTGRVLLIYSFIFLLISYFIYSFFKIQDKSMISGIDAYTQHFINMIHWRELIINCVKSGGGTFNSFLWNLGTGIDMYANYAYYTIGDFVNYFSVFFPINKMETFYTGAIFVRLYFVGFNFIIYCKYKNYHNFPSLVGSLLYTFCFYALYGGFRHIYFLNALALFPLLMMGMDKIVLENKKLFYIFIIFISFLSSFYFAYMTSLCLLIYGSILIISEYKKKGLKEIIKQYIKVFLCSLLGVLIASFVLIPTFYLYLNSERSGGSITDYIYTYTYYKNIFKSFNTYTGTNWVILGIHSIIFITLPIAFYNFKQHRYELLFLLILLIPLFIAPAGSILDCLSYPNNRWSYVIVFLLSMISVKVIDNFKRLSNKNLILIILFVICDFYIMYQFNNSFDKSVIYSIILILLSLLFFSNKTNIENLSLKFKFLKKIKLYEFLFVIFIVSTTITHSKLLIYTYGSADEFIKDNYIFKLYNSNYEKSPKFSVALNRIKDNDTSFYKIGRTSSALHNESIYFDYNSIDYFYSIIPSNDPALSVDLSNITYYTNFDLKQFDYRTKITTLLGTKYFITNNSKNIPYGYSFYAKDNKKTITYKNDYYTNFMQYYDNFITLDKYNSLSNIEKESSLLKYAALDDDINNQVKIKNNTDELSKSFSKVPFTKSIDENKLKVVSTDGKKANNKIIINIDENKVKGELYLKIDNINFTPMTKKELHSLLVENETTTEKDFNYSYQTYMPLKNMRVTVKYQGQTDLKDFKDSRTNPYSSGDNNILANLGYYDEINGQIEVTLSELGTYTFDNIEVLAVNFDDYKQDISNLNRSNFELIEYKNGYASGTVDLEKEGIIQIMTSYSDGWDIYLDGEKTDKLNVNKYFLGLYVPKGKHKIKIKYHTPYLKESIVISIISLLIYIVVCIFEVKRGSQNGKK